MDNLKEKVVIAVSSRALFDLEEEHALFEEKGYKAFRDHQVRYQNTPLRPGVAFPFVRRLLALNELYGDLAPFRVIALSRNSPETAQRFFHSCRHYRLPISAGGFTSGPSTYPYLAAFNASLFLSANPENVRNAIAAGQPAGLVMPSPVGDEDDDASPTLRIAFDFDGVIADDESEREYQKEGLSGFHRLEQEKASTPHSPGPLRRLFEQLSAFQRFDYNHRGAADPYFEPAVRISIVTAQRGAPDHHTEKLRHERRGALSARRSRQAAVSQGHQAAHLLRRPGEQPEAEPQHRAVRAGALRHPSSGEASLASWPPIRICFCLSRWARTS